jgi:hypothetical protein
MFAVYAPPQGSKVASPFNIMWMVPDPNVAPIVWQIECSDSYFWGVHTEGLVIVYPKVPSGCRQTAPASELAPVLSPETVYSFSVETFYGKSTAFANGYLYVDHSGNTGPATIPDLCLQRSGSRQLRVNCKTNEPYQDPVDLEEFIRKGSPGF